MPEYIFKSVESITIFKHQTVLHLSCGHSIIDYINLDNPLEKWQLGNKLNCESCLSAYRILRMQVDEKD